MFLLLRVWKDFSLNTEKKIYEDPKRECKIETENLLFSKEENIRKEWFVHATAREHNSNHVNSPAICEQTLWIPDSRFWISDSFIFKTWILVFLVIRTWIQDWIVTGISDSLIWIPDSKAQDFRRSSAKSNDFKLHKQNYSGFRN